METMTESERRIEVARQLRKVTKVTAKLGKLYPELAASFRIHEALYQRSVAAAILLVEQAKQ